MKGSAAVFIADGCRGIRRAAVPSATGIAGRRRWPVRGRFLLALFLLTHWIAPRLVQAAHYDCAASGSPRLPATVSLVNLDVPRDLPVGAVIPGSTISMTWTFTCNSTGVTGGKPWALHFQTPAVSITAVSGLDGVYKQAQSEVAGVGFRFRDASGAPMAIGAFGGYSAATSLGPAPAGQTSFRWSGSFELVKTAETVSSGAQKLQPQISVENQVWGNGSAAGSYFVVDYAIRKPALTTCSVTSSAQTVALPTVSLNALGTGSSSTDDATATAGSTAFNISLKCQKGARLYMLMTDANFPGARSNLLFPKNGQWGALGIRIQREDGTNVTFSPDSATAGADGQWFVGDTPDGVLNIPLRASYYHYRCGTCSAASVPVGTFSVQATYTFSYQ